MEQENLTLQDIIKSYSEFLKERGPYAPTKEEMKLQDNFEKSLKEILENMPKILLPWVGSVLSAVGLSAATFVPVAVLSAMGFTTAGVAAGSVAATWQSSIGSVAAGSTFAGLQSVGATGLLFPPALLVAGIGVVGGAAVFGSVVGIRHLRVKKQQKEWNEGHQEDLQKLKNQLLILQKHVVSQSTNVLYSGAPDKILRIEET